MSHDPGTDRSLSLAALRTHYGCGPVTLGGNDDALYERHLIFDNVLERRSAGPREQYEAVARSVRDVSVAAVDQDRGHLRSTESKAHLLSIHGVSDW